MCILYVSTVSLQLDTIKRKLNQRMLSYVFAIKMADKVQHTSLFEREQRTRYAFRGVYMSDQLPFSSPPLPQSLYVCNTDPSDEPGQHQVVIYVEKAERADYFDSLGCPPVVQHFRHFLDHNATTWRCNTKPVQHPLSDACGHHCLFYSCHRCLHYDIDYIVHNMYTDDLRLNDQLVKDFVRELLTRYTGFFLNNWIFIQGRHTLHGESYTSD
jgi:hypothetical protein